MTAASNSDRNPVEALADDFLRRQRGGERPTLEEYCRRHPELADEIRDVFPVLIRMEDLRSDAQKKGDIALLSLFFTNRKKGTYRFYRSFSLAVRVSIVQASIRHPDWFGQSHRFGATKTSVDW